MPRENEAGELTIKAIDSREEVQHIPFVPIQASLPVQSHRLHHCLHILQDLPFWTVVIKQKPGMRLGESRWEGCGAEVVNLKLFWA